eukprot:3494403-Prymnesium_polylepis.1
MQLGGEGRVPQREACSAEERMTEGRCFQRAHCCSAVGCCSAEKTSTQPRTVAGTEAVTAPMSRVASRPWHVVAVICLNGTACVWSQEFISQS